MQNLAQQLSKAVGKGMGLTRWRRSGFQSDPFAEESPVRE